MDKKKLKEGENDIERCPLVGTGLERRDLYDR